MRCPTIHLVDSVPAITAKLVEKYACYIDDHLVIECKDARSIEWRIDTSHLMILAGIGGSTMVDIIKGIINKPVTHHHKPVGLNIEFILSPNRNAFELRSFLRDRNFELIKEEFVTEKDWHHEHLHLRYHTEIPCMKPVSATGDDLWAGVSDEKKSYIRMQIKHYEKRAALGGHEASKSALEEYTRLLRRMESTIG